VQNVCFAVLQGHEQVFLSIEEGVVVSITAYAGFFLTFSGRVRGNFLIIHVVFVFSEFQLINFGVVIIFVELMAVSSQTVSLVMDSQIVPDFGLLITIVVL
jgi:hypothetical protein